MRLADYNLALTLESWALAHHGTAVSATSSVESVAGLSTLNQPSVAHLLSRRSELHWRSETISAGTDVHIVFDFGQPRPVDAVVLAKTNLVEGEIFYTMHNADPLPLVGGSLGSEAVVTSSVYQMTVQATPGDFTFDSFPWLTGPGEARLLELQAQRRLSTIVPGPSLVAARYLAITLRPWSSGTNGADDYFEVALPLPGRLWRPDRSMVYGWRITPTRPDRTIQTLAGNLDGYDQVGGRLFSFQLPAIKDGARAWGALGDLEAAGRLQPVWFWAEPQKPHLYYEQSFAATVSELPGLGHDTFHNSAFDEIELREVR